MTLVPRAPRMSTGEMSRGASLPPARNSTAPSALSLGLRFDAWSAQLHVLSPWCLSTVRNCSAFILSTTIVSWPKGVRRDTPCSNRSHRPAPACSWASETADPLRLTVKPALSMVTATRVAASWRSGALATDEPRAFARNEGPDRAEAVPVKEAPPARTTRSGASRTPSRHRDAGTCRSLASRRFRRPSPKRSSFARKDGEDNLSRAGLFD